MIDTTLDQSNFITLCPVLTKNKHSQISLLVLSVVPLEISPYYKEVQKYFLLHSGTFEKVFNMKNHLSTWKIVGI
jgi:hypothetical protein